MKKFILGVVSVAATAFSLSAAAQLQVDVDPITWNVIGLDSNKPATSQPAPGVYPPDRFPVGVEVCASGATMSGYKAVFVWDGATPTPNYYHLWDSTVDWNAATPVQTEAPSFQGIQDLADGSCTDIYFWVQIEQVSAAYDFTRSFHIEVQDGANAKVAETPNLNATLGLAEERELYTEFLVSQNRNSVDGYEVNGRFYAADGTASVPIALGQTFELKLLGSTATQGYEQIEAFITLPPDIFTVTEVSATYSANAGTDPNASKQLYADGCGWINNPAQTGYHESSSVCTGVGKYGGTITKTYQIKVADTLPSNPTVAAQALIYDFSGSSYHYNADHDSSSIELRIYDPAEPTDPNKPTGGEPVLPTYDVSILKSVNYNGQSDSGTWFFDVTRVSGTGNLVDIVIDDFLPRSYIFKNDSASALTVPYGTVAYYSDNSTYAVSNESAAFDSGDKYFVWTFTLPSGVNTTQADLNFTKSGIVATTTEDRTNCAQIQADADSTNNLSCVVIPVAAKPWDVGVQKAVSDISVDAFGVTTVTFDISVNTVAGINTEVSVSDFLPAGYTFVGLVPSSEQGGLTFDGQSAGVISMTYAGGSTSGSLKFTAVANLPNPADSIDTIEANYLNSVQLIDSTTGLPLTDQNTGNNKATAGYVPPLLQVDKTPASKGVDDNTKGTPFDYVITVTKVAGFQADNTIVLVETPPAGMEFTAITEAGGSITWSCQDAGLNNLATDGTLFAAVTSAVTCERTVQAGEQGREVYPALSFKTSLNPVPTVNNQSYYNYVYVEGFDGTDSLPYTFNDDSAKVTYTQGTVNPVNVSGIVFLDNVPSGGYDGLRTTENPSSVGGNTYACIDTVPTQFDLIEADGLFLFSSVPANSSYNVILFASQVAPTNGDACPTQSTLNDNWYSTGESQDGAVTDSTVISKQTISDGKLGISVGTTDLTTLTFGVRQGDVFDPPFGIKTGEFLNGQPIIRWTMVWINDSPINVNGAVITDPPPTGTQYVDLSIKCFPAGVTTVSTCEFDNINKTVHVVADFGPEVGNPTDEATAANESNLNIPLWALITVERCQAAT